jgi:ribosomal 50S subunit-associated protein YjgA (DUF615 family)
MTNTEGTLETGETEEERQSKSARKREAAALQDLGVQLSALPDQEIKELGAARAAPLALPWCAGAPAPVHRQADAPD